MDNKLQRAQTDRREAIAVYKAILKQILDQRPSGMRNRLAEALGKNRSFVSQITNAAYDTPIPAGHLAPIFELCHFSAEERQSFLKAYDTAHPGTRDEQPRIARARSVSIRLPDFGDDALNAKVDRMLQKFATDLGRTFSPSTRPGNQSNPSARASKKDKSQ